MSYISQSTHNSPCNHVLSSRNRDNFWILRIGIKKTTTIQQNLEAISGQQLIVKQNRVHVITARRDKDIVISNIQENRCILNKTRHI